MITHYIPQFLLREFRAQTLFELDKSTNAVEPRKVKKAGQSEDLYPPHVENGLFRRVDNNAARILRKKVYRQNRITLTDEEKQVLSEWLLLFAVRIPLNLTVCNRSVELWEANPANSLDVLDEDLDLVIASLKKEHPAEYGDKVNQYGEEAVKIALHQAMRESILSGKHAKPDGQMLFEQMHTSGKHQGYVRHLSKLKWTWLRTNSDFVIGDNPLCRWDVRNGVFNHGLARPHLEITIPITRKITLWMHRNYSHSDMALCNAARTKELNRRQIDSAVQVVFGPTEEAFGTILNP